MENNTIETIKSTADLIINDYAFLCYSDFVKVVNLTNIEREAILQLDGKVTKTNMNGVEIDIVRNYWKDNRDAVVQSRAVKDLTNRANDIINRWKEVKAKLNKKPFNKLIVERAINRSRDLLYVHLDLVTLKFDMIEYLDDPVIDKLYQELDRILIEINIHDEQIHPVIEAHELSYHAGTSKLIGKDHNVQSNYLDDEKIKKEMVATSATENHDIIFQLLKFSGLIFVSFFIGVIIYGLLEDALPLEILGSSSISQFIASLCALICGVSTFALPFIREKGRGKREIKFAQNNYKKSRLLAVKFIKVVQETKYAHYVHFYADGKKQIVPIDSQTYCDLLGNKSIQYIYVLKYPKYKSGYGYMAFNPMRFDNQSSIQHPTIESNQQ